MRLRLSFFFLIFTLVCSLGYSRPLNCPFVLALVANADHKPALISFARNFRRTLTTIKLIGTSGTAQQLANEVGLTVEPVSHGPEGGDIDIAYGLVHGTIHGLIFFIDAGKAQPHDEDIGTLFRQSTRLNIPFAPNPATAYYLLLGMERRYLFGTEELTPISTPWKSRDSRRQPAVVVSANDSLKETLLETLKNHRPFFERVKIFATGKTAKRIADELGFSVTALPEGRDHGNHAIQELIEQGKIDAVFSFRDVSTLSGYDDEARAMIRTVLTHDLPFAANAVTADFLLYGLENRP